MFLVSLFQMYDNLAKLASNSPFGSPFTVAKCETKDSRSVSAGKFDNSRSTIISPGEVCF